MEIEHRILFKVANVSENIQRLFTAHIDPIKYLNYWECLEVLVEEAGIGYSTLSVIAELKWLSSWQIEVEQDSVNSCRLDWVYWLWDTLDRLG